MTKTIDRVVVNFDEIERRTIEMRREGDSFVWGSQRLIRDYFSTPFSYSN